MSTNDLVPSHIWHMATDHYSDGEATPFTSYACMQFYFWDKRQDLLRLKTVVDPLKTHAQDEQARYKRSDREGFL